MKIKRILRFLVTLYKNSDLIIFLLLQSVKGLEILSW